MRDLKTEAQRRYANYQQKSFGRRWVIHICVGSLLVAVGVGLFKLLQPLGTAFGAAGLIVFVVGMAFLRIEPAGEPEWERRLMRWRRRRNSERSD